MPLAPFIGMLITLYLRICHFYAARTLRNYEMGLHCEHIQPRVFWTMTRQAIGGIEITPPSLTDEANLEVHVVWGELQVLG